MREVIVVLFLVSFLCILSSSSSSSSSTCHLSRYVDRNNKENEESFDFIIVGGGTAGCVIARRLSDFNSNWTILLLEAGFDASSDPLVSDPDAFPSLLYSTKITWNDFAQRSVNPNAPLPPLYIGMGKTLGGGSSVNALGYQRGAEDTFDLWADLVQDSSWSFESLLTYFKLAENSSFALQDPQQRGSGGPLNVLTHPIGPFQTLWEKTGIELGFPVNEDINSVPNPYGFGTEQFTISNMGTRMGTNEGYLQPILNSNSNLHLSVNSFVTKIILNSSNQSIVSGVTYIANGIPKTAYSKKEVIISAGGLRSPALLLLSGLGGAVVGQNLQDHPGLSVPWRHNFTDPTLYPQNQPCVFFNTTSQPFNSSFPLADMLGSLDFQPYPSQSFIVKFFLVRNELRGNVSLNNQNPLDPPLIFLDYFSSPDLVLNRFVEAIRLLRTILTSPSLSSLGFTEVSPGFGITSDEDLSNWVMDNVYTNCHLSGSCRMGPYGSRNESVVNPELKLHGISGIRLADTSIVPLIPSGTPYNTAVMIGEKTAGLIMTEWKQE